MSGFGWEGDPSELEDHAAIAAEALEAALAAGDEGSVATCDLCGRDDDHQHAAEEWGFPDFVERENWEVEG